MALIDYNAPYKTKNVALANSSKTDILTCDDAHILYVLAVNVCASAGASGTADILHYDGTTEYTLRYHGVVPAAGSYEVEFRPLVLRPTHVLRVTGAAAQHVSVSYIERAKSDPTGVRL